jgi:hypothetical protein
MGCIFSSNLNQSILFFLSLTNEFFLGVVFFNPNLHTAFPSRYPLDIVPLLIYILTLPTTNNQPPFLPTYLPYIFSLAKILPFKQKPLSFLGNFFVYWQNLYFLYLNYYPLTKSPFSWPNYYFLLVLDKNFISLGQTFIVSLLNFYTSTKKIYFQIKHQFLTKLFYYLVKLLFLDKSTNFF